MPNNLPLTVYDHAESTRYHTNFRDLILTHASRVSYDKDGFIAAPLQPTQAACYRAVSVRLSDVRWRKQFPLIRILTSYDL